MGKPGKSGNVVFWILTHNKTQLPMLDDQCQAKRFNEKPAKVVDYHPERVSDVYWMDVGNKKVLVIRII